MKENNKSNKKELNTCQYAKKCGGCDYQGISYSEQLSQKQKYIEKLMKPFGNVNPIVGMTSHIITDTRYMLCLTV